MAEPYVRPDVRQFLDYLNALPGPKTHELGPAEARTMMLASRQVADAPVGELAVIRDLAFPGPGGEVGLRLYDAREDREAGPLVLFFHGGGFVLGDLDSHEPFCAEMARALDLPVLAVDYRLAPEHPWPAGIEDAIAAAYWAAGSPEALGRTVTGLVTCGDSAGGNFAIIVTLALRDTPAKVPVHRAMADLSGRPSRRGLSELRGFRRRLSADQAGDELVRGLLQSRSSRLALQSAGEEPGRDAADPGDHRKPRSDPRPGPRLCRGLHPGRGSDHLPRGGRQYPWLHLPEEGDPLRRRRH